MRASVTPKVTNGQNQASITKFFNQIKTKLQPRLISSSQDCSDTHNVSMKSETDDASKTVMTKNPTNGYPNGDFHIKYQKPTYSKIKRKYELVPDTEPVHRKHKFDKP